MQHHSNFLASPAILCPNKTWTRLSYLLCLPRRPPHVNTHCRYYAGRDQDLNTSRNLHHPVILHSSPATMSIYVGRPARQAKEVAQPRPCFVWTQYGGRSEKIRMMLHS